MNTHTEGGKVYSYGTHVATIDHDGRRVIEHGKWSGTTSRHVHAAARALGYVVVQDPRGQAGSEGKSGVTFGAQRIGIVKEDREEGQGQAMDPLPVLRMFAALATVTSRTPEEEARAHADLLRRTPGIVMPEGWDALPLEERQRRIGQAMKAAQ